MFASDTYDTEKDVEMRYSSNVTCTVNEVRSAVFKGTTSQGKRFEIRGKRGDTSVGQQQELSGGGGVVE